jgi:hypothetical protein
MRAAPHIRVIRIPTPATITPSERSIATINKNIRKGNRPVPKAATVSSSASTAPTRTPLWRKAEAIGYVEGIRVSGVTGSTMMSSFAGVCEPY